MARCTRWLVLGLLGSLVALGQEQTASDTKTLESFLLQVAQQRIDYGAVPSGLTRPSVKDTLAFLTDQEVQTLSSIAGDLEARSTSLEKAMKSLVFERRLAAIAAEAPSPSVSSRLEQLSRQHTQTVADHIQQLRAALGDSRFELVETFVNSRKDWGSFFPVVSADGSRPVSMPKAKAVAR